MIEKLLIWILSRPQALRSGLIFTLIAIAAAIGGIVAASYFSARPAHIVVASLVSAWLFGMTLLLVYFIVIQGKRVKAASARAAAAQLTPWLYKEIGHKVPPPYLDDWTLEAGAIIYLSRLLRQRKPRLVVELGAGASTVILSALGQELGFELISIEHDSIWANRVQSNLVAWNLHEKTRIELVPISRKRGAGRKSAWYDISGMDQVFSGRVLEFLIVDGPTRRPGKSVRAEALQYFMPMLSNNAVIMADDVNRPAERAMVADWLRQYPDFRLTEIEGDKIVAFLERRGRKSN